MLSIAPNSMVARLSKSEWLPVPHWHSGWIRRIFDLPLTLFADQFHDAVDALCLLVRTRSCTLRCARLFNSRIGLRFKAEPTKRVAAPYAPAAV
jgi:hypothetical protein